MIIDFIIIKFFLFLFNNVINKDDNAIVYNNKVARL